MHFRLKSEHAMSKHPEYIIFLRARVSVIQQKTIKGVEKVATPSTLFYAENAAILPLWAGMIVWPEEKITKAVMSTYAPVVVAALIYVWLTYECFQVRMTSGVVIVVVDLLLY